MSYKAIIIEDEQPARNIIKNYLSELPDIEVIAEYADGFSGVKAVNELKPDMIFLDIQMPRLTGFEVLELIEHKPAVIFTTAYDQYAIKAFEVSASDYLLKPFSKERFVKAVRNTICKLTQPMFSESTIAKVKNSLEDDTEIIKRVAVRTGNKIVVFPVDSIIFIEADGDYVLCHTSDESYLKDKTMKYYETHLDKSVFVRIHRSYIVNVNFIDQLEYYDKDSYVAILKNKKRLKISVQGYRLLKEALKL